MSNIEWNQHLIAIFNGEGFVIVHDDVFKKFRARDRLDTNLDEVQAKTFVQNFLNIHNIPREFGEPLSFRRVYANRTLAIMKREYEIFVHVVRVPTEYKLRTANEPWNKHELADKLQNTLSAAQVQFERRAAVAHA